MSQPATFWRKCGTLAQMAQAGVALLGYVVVPFTIYATGRQRWIKALLQRAGFITPDCKLRKT